MPIIKSHGFGSPLAFFVADAPVGQDFDTGFALTGYSGSVLRDFCAEQALSLDSFWRSCFIKEGLPPDSLEKLKFEQEIERLKLTWGPLLIEEINDLKPNLIIPLGERSFNYLTGLNNIRKFRGSILPPGGTFQLSVPNLKVLPILGPYPFLNKEYKLR